LLYSSSTSGSGYWEINYNSQITKDFLAKFLNSLIVLPIKNEINYLYYGELLEKFAFVPYDKRRYVSFRGPVIQPFIKKIKYSKEERIGGELSKIGHTDKLIFIVEDKTFNRFDDACKYIIDNFNKKEITLDITFGLEDEHTDKYTIKLKGKLQCGVGWWRDGGLYLKENSGCEPIEIHIPSLKELVKAKHGSVYKWVGLYKRNDNL